MEFFLFPGSYADVNALYDFSFPVHSGSVIYGDRAYNAYNIEDELKRSNVDLNPIKKKNSKRKHETFTEDGIKLIRKMIESVFSVIAQRFPRHIHAVTSHGFELKIFPVVLAYGIEKAMMQVTTWVICSNQDREAAAKIVHHLRSSGYTWFDVDEVTSGQKWIQAIINGIAESAVALNLSGNKFVTEELEAAMSVMRSKDESFSPVISIRLDDSDIPQELVGVQGVDLRNEDGLEKLEKGLKRILGLP